MADRYWVNGTGTWDGINVLNWSDASGGLPGASVPTSADNVFFDANSNIGTSAFTVTTGTANCLNFSIAGTDGAMTLSIGTALNVFGSWVSSTNTTISGSGSLIFAATSGVRTITSNGRTFDCPVTFNGVGGAWQLQDALTIGSTRTLTLTNGSLDLNGRTLTSGVFSSSNSNVRTITLTNASVVVLASGTAWQMSTATNATINASGSTISMNSASSKTFNLGSVAGGGKTLGTLNQGGAGTLIINGSNTFANITNTVLPASIRLTSGTTQTVGAFGVSGTAGNLVTLNSSTAGSQATLSDSSGTNVVSFTSIKDIAATGGATWNAPTSSGNVNAGNNTGWNFNNLLFRYIYTRRKNKVIFPI